MDIKATVYKHIKKMTDRVTAVGTNFKNATNIHF